MLVWRPKQALVPLYGFLLVVCTTSWLTGILIASLLHLPSIPLLIASALAILITILLWSQSHLRIVLLCLTFLILGMLRYAWSDPNNQANALIHYLGIPSIRLHGTVAQEPTASDHARTLIVAIDKILLPDNPKWQPATGLLELQTLGHEVIDPYRANYGDEVEISGKLESPSADTPVAIQATMTFPYITIINPAAFSPWVWLSQMRQTMATLIARSLPQPEAGLLIALFLGLRTSGLRPSLPLFRTTGTLHMIVPSGFKVTILCGFLTTILHLFIRKPFKSQARHHWQDWLTLILTLFGVLVYTMLNGSGPAALRSGLMGAILILAPFLRRDYLIYNSLACAALVLTLTDPLTIFDIGFQLSFLGTLGIVLFTPFFQKLLGFLNRLPAGIFVNNLISTTLAAELATLPIFAYSFDSISLIAPIANTLTVPLLGIFISLGLLVCCGAALWLPLGLLGGWIAYPSLWYMLKIVSFCASIPYAAISLSINLWLFFFYYGLLILCSWLKIIPLPSYHRQENKQSAHSVLHLSKHWQISLACIIILSTGFGAVVTPNLGHYRISFLPVRPLGKALAGQAILIQTPHDQRILIDGGPDSASLAQELDSRLPSWQHTLQAVILTNPDSAYLTGLQDLVQRYTIEHIYDAGMLHPSVNYANWRRQITERGFPYQQLTTHASIQIDSMKIEVLGPTHPLQESSDPQHEHALILQLVLPQFRLLLLGASALNNRAIDKALTEFSSNSEGAEIVQMVGSIQHPYPTNLVNVLQIAQPGVLIITPPPPARSTTQESNSPLLPTLPAHSQTSIIQTRLVGLVELETAEKSGYTVLPDSDEGQTIVSSGTQGYKQLCIVDVAGTPSKPRIPFVLDVAHLPIKPPQIYSKIRFTLPL